MATRRGNWRWRLPIGLRFTLVLSLIPLLVLPLIGLRFVELMTELARNERLETLDISARNLAVPLHERPELFLPPDATPRPDSIRSVPVASLDVIDVDQRADEWLAVGAQPLIDVGTRSEAARPVTATLRVARSQAAPGKLYLLVDSDDERLVRPQIRDGVRLTGDELIVSFGDRSAEMREIRVQPVERNDGWLAEIEIDPEPELLRIRIIDVDYLGSRRVEGELDTGLLAPAKADSERAAADPRIALWQSPSRSLARAAGRVSVYDASGELLARTGELKAGEEIGSGWQTRLARTLFRVADALRPAAPDVLVVGDPAPVAAGEEPPAPGSGVTVVHAPDASAPAPPAKQVVSEDGAKATTISVLTRALSGLPAHSIRRLSADIGMPAWLLSSAHPVWVGDRVVGALVIEENTASRLAFGQRAIERLTLLAALALLSSTVALLLVGSVTVWRIVRLRRAAERAIDPYGRVVGRIQPSAIGDEIGALTHSHAKVLERLGQHQQYLGNLRSRLVHELRTPIMVVRSSLDNLAAESDERLRADYLERVRDGAQRLERILSSMGEASSLESMLTESELEVVSLAALVEGCTDGYRSAFGDRFELDRDPSEARCPVVPDAIAQALDKLVSNAIDFAEPDSPIRISLRRAGERRPAWRISVANRGPSLPPNMGDLLFDSMVSVRRGRAGRSTHLGMGLYMVRLVAEFHGGRAVAHDVRGGVEVGFTVRAARSEH